jgi:large subunit ribosomal protein L14
MGSRQMIFFVIDNSGGRTAICINVYGSKFVKPGSLVILSLRSNKLISKIKKGTVCRAVVVQLVKHVFRRSGYQLSFNKNAVVILKKLERSPLGNRVSRHMFREVRYNGFGRVASLGLGLI